MGKNPSLRKDHRSMREVKSKTPKRVCPYTWANVTQLLAFFKKK
jgi:hypothetical protein